MSESGLHRGYITIQQIVVGDLAELIRTTECLVPDCTKKGCHARSDMARAIAVVSCGDHLSHIDPTIYEQYRIGRWNATQQYPLSERSPTGTP